MSACISPSDEPLARRLIALTEAGLPLVADPWPGSPNSCS